MGFGIPDEVLEKIISSMVYDPDRDGQIISSYNKSADERLLDLTEYKNYPSTVPQTTYKIPVTSASCVPDKNTKFLLSLEQTISDVFTKNLYGTFHSVQYKDLFDCYHEYIEKTVRAVVPDSISCVRQNSTESVRKFLFGGVSEHILKKMYSDSLKKQDFRNLIDDTVELMRFWKIQPDNTTHSKAVFFNYFKSNYGLKENQYFCCPNCGAQLIVGFKNCPNCYELISNNFSATGQMCLDTSNLDGDTEQRNNNRQLQHEIESINSKNKELLKTNVALQEENKRLYGQLAGQDVAIHALQNSIYGSREETKIKGKLLIIGDSALTASDIASISNSCGIDPDMIEYKNDYSKLKQFAIRIKKEGCYSGIIVGAVPHKVKGLGDANSLSVLFQGEGYPYTVEARTFSGALKITSESLRRAMSKMFYHFVNRGII